LNNETINRLLYSPLKGSTILYGKMLFAFFISILQLTSMVLFAWLKLKMDLSVNIPTLILMIIATTFAVSSLGIFLAAIAKTLQQAQNLSTIILILKFLSTGCSF
jgi:ABC-type Na+ efflux pump permease subunit